MAVNGNQDVTLCEDHSFMRLHFFISLATVFVVTSCSPPKADVQLVREGVLSFDNSTTIGKAFDGYSYFTKTAWTSTTTETGRTFVEATGTVDFARLTAKDVAVALFGLSGKAGDQIVEAASNSPKTIMKAKRFSITSSSYSKRSNLYFSL